jgi:outer membrane immunogenic protein
VEGDWNGAGIDGGADVDSLTFASEIDSFASVRARAGWAADRWLFFVTGGWGWAGASDTHEDSMFGLFDADMTLDGGTLGGGLEYAFTDNVIGRVEYRHYEFDSKNSDGRFDTDLDTVSAGVSIKF